MDNKPLLATILENALRVIRDPVGFYRDMPKTGGLTDPVIFVIVMAVVTGVLIAVLSLVGFGAFGAMAMGIGAIILFPVMALIGTFIGGAILFVIWKLMGSNESFETAYRCVAYATALYPITAVLGLIPYIGAVVGVVWGMYLMVVASVEVHQLRSQTAWAVFGVLGLILILLNVGSEKASREMASNFEQMGLTEEELEEMSPEEAGRAMGEFLKGFEEAARQQQQ